MEHPRELIDRSQFGAFAGHPRLGAAGMGNNGIQMMGCCPPEGLRGLWEAWRWAVQEVGREVRVNLALTREHPAARVSAWRGAPAWSSGSPFRTFTSPGACRSCHPIREG